MYQSTRFTYKLTVRDFKGFPPTSAASECRIWVKRGSKKSATFILTVLSRHRQFDVSKNLIIRSSMLRDASLYLRKTIVDLLHNTLIFEAGFSIWIHHIPGTWQYIHLLTNQGSFVSYVWSSTPYKSSFKHD